MANPNTFTGVHLFIHYLKELWPIALAFIAFVVSILIVIKGKIPRLEEKLEEANGRIKELENQRYQPIVECTAIREECKMYQKEYHDTFCKKLDTISSELRSIVVDADQKREDTRTEITGMNRQLIELMTQMKTILARDRRQETAEMVRLVVDQVFKQMKTTSVVNGRT